MSLFGKTKSLEIATENEAFFAIIFTCIALDGEITVEEMHDVTGLFQKHHLFGDVNLNSYYSKMKKLYKQAGSWEAMLEHAVPHLTDEMRPTVYANVMDIVFADGIFDRPEQQLVHHLKVQLDIPDNLHDQIMEVIRIKNQWAHQRENHT